MPCKHAKLALIYAQQMAEMDEPWKLWEHSYGGETWKVCDEMPQWHEEREYRQIPKTLSINGFDVPEPMREKPEIGTEYWMIESTSESGVTRITWDGGGFDIRAFNRGLCHLTRDNCIIHATAVFSFSEIKEQL